MKPQLIAFSGPMGVGKTTAAQYLVDNYGYTRMSFADPLREMLRVLGLTDEDFSQEGKRRPHPALSGKTPREALQTLGTEWGRNHIGPDIWCEAAIRRAYHAVQLGQCVVFDDCRFDNEAQAVLRMCGVVIELERPGVARAGVQHASEVGLPPESVSFHLFAPDLSTLRSGLSELITR
ncbi:MAG: hypothetical protein SFV32_12705 [Opitutaceae bacterium]|nr:hypothetical protein [Opitutaceae bacterium]